MACGTKKHVKTKRRSSTSTTQNKTTSKPIKEVKSVAETRKIEPVKETPKVAVKRKRTSVDDYIDNYSKIAMLEMRKSKIPASITLAQGILESGSGNGRLAIKANNHFGIKCHNWNGEKIYHDDDESQECFRKYKKAESSYKDHSEFLVGRKRYSKLFLLKLTDYKGWAKGLRAAGYATDPRYPQKLISLIERYKLYNFDKKVLNTKQEVTAIDTDTGISHKVIKGDTLYGLSKKYNISIEELKANNNLKSNQLSIGQIIKIK